MMLTWALGLLIFADAVSIYYPKRTAHSTEIEAFATVGDRDIEARIHLHDNSQKDGYVDFTIKGTDTSVTTHRLKFDSAHSGKVIPFMVASRELVELVIDPTSRAVQMRSGKSKDFVSAKVRNTWKSREYSHKHD